VQICTTFNDSEQRGVVRFAEYFPAIDLQQARQLFAGIGLSRIILSH